MSVGHREPLASPDHRLDGYRGRVAQVRLDDQLVGYLLVRVRTWWTQRGHLWWRSWGDPREHAEWLIEYITPPPWTTLNYADGIVPAEHAEQRVREWDRNEFTVGRGTVVDLVWLDVAQAAEAPVSHDWLADTED